MLYYSNSLKGVYRMTSNELNIVQELLGIDKAHPVMDLLRCFHDPVSEGLENRQIRRDEEWNEPAWCAKYDRCMADVECKLHRKRRADFKAQNDRDGISLNLGEYGPEADFKAQNGAAFIEEIVVNDPDTNLPVAVALYKHDNGGIFGIDSSFVVDALEENEPAFDPFDGNKVSLSE
jgi:hypothetical protein